LQNYENPDKKANKQPNTSFFSSQPDFTVTNIGEKFGATYGL